MRCFAALELSPEAIDACLAAQAQLDSVWRRVPRENLHVTIAFFPAVTALDALAASVPDLREAVALTMDTILLLPRVVTVGLRSDSFAALSRAIHDATIEWTSPSDRARKPLPHVTIGRCREVNLPASLRHSSQAIPVEGVTWKSERVVLFESLAQGGTRRYVPRHYWPLRS